MRDDEIKDLREEIAKLRERVAVLEANRTLPWPYAYGPVPSVEPFVWRDAPTWTVPTVTTDTVTLSAHEVPAPSMRETNDA